MAKDDSVEPLLTHHAPYYGVLLKLGVIDDVRTFSQTGKKRWLNRLIKEAAAMRHTEDGQGILNNIRTLRQRFEPQTFVKEMRYRHRANAA